MTYYSRLLLSAAVFLGCSPAVRAVTPEEGRRIYLEAKEGNAESQYRLGLCFLKGDGVKRQSLPGQILVFQGGQAGAPHGGTLPAPDSQKGSAARGPLRRPRHPGEEGAGIV